MADSDIEVAIVGGGAAGVAAGRALHDAGIRCLVIEARDRLGGRAWTVTHDGVALDLGCGWLHSADRNPWREVAETQGRALDKSAPPWQRPSLTHGFPLAQQHAFLDALQAYHERLGAAAEGGADVAAATLLEPGGRWNGLIGAVTSYISGTEPERLSVQDFARYDDSGVNWRVIDGYGITVAAHAAHVPLMLDCPLQRIDHSGKRLRIETARGAITADQAIVTLPSALLTNETLFAPALPEKVAAAAGLPLGLADKLFLALDGAEEFEKDSRLFGATDRSGIGAYHLRPFGRPMIEAYFGGACAAALEAEGMHGFTDFAVTELTALLGRGFAARVKPIAMHCWGTDPFARGSYSYALPGRADCRAALAATVDDRLFFAGEACSEHDFSTAHGGYITGFAAAEAVRAARAGQRG